MKVKFTVLGMSCSACSNAVERVVNKVEGVSVATVSLTQKLLVVEGDFLVAEIIKAVKNAGFKARLYSDKKSEDNGSELKKRLIFSVICLVVLMYFSMGAMIGLPTFNFLKGEGGAIYNVSLQIILATVVIILNKKFFINGYRAVIHLAPNMDTLVALGSGASYLFGVFAFVMIIIGKTSGDSALINTYLQNLYFESSAMILTLVTVGKTLEEKAKTRTESAVSKLKKLAPETATVIKNGEEITVKVSEIAVGDIVVVKAGESASADGEVIFGEGEMNESSITGESLPITVGVGSLIKSATVCVNGYLKIKVTATGSQTVFGKIISSATIPEKA